MRDGKGSPVAPSVSIIVCAYNAAATITETLASLQVQSWRDCEILVLDDGSVDDTAEIVAGIAAQDPRVRLVVNKRNRGTAYTRQRGLYEARSEIVTFFDSDDLALPDFVERLHACLVSDPDCMGVSCYAEYFDEGCELGLQRVGALSKEEFLEKWRGNKLYFQSMVTLTYQSLALQVGGFRQDLLPNAEGIRYEDYAEDLDLWCRMADLGAEGRYFVTLPEPLFRYRKPKGSLSTKNLRYMQLKMRWIKDCLRRRRAGAPERDLAAFVASRGPRDRWRDWRADKAAACYKKAGFAWSRRSWLGLGWYLGLTALASPKLVVQKFKTQAVRR